MQTPDPNNPQPGDQLVSFNKRQWTVLAVDTDDGVAWCKGPAGERDEFPMSTVATWTPVTPTPPDMWRTFYPDGAARTWGTAEHAIAHASRIGGKVARYTFAEWVTP